MFATVFFERAGWGTGESQVPARYDSIQLQGSITACPRMSSHVLACPRMSSHVLACPSVYTHWQGRTERAFYKRGKTRVGADKRSIRRCRRRRRPPCLYNGATRSIFHQSASAVQQTSGRP
ncbi:hypothetical protein OUZ56_031291 [Daphnia magna]|uniref:Uncharacterized protein n=1 Tax=Daphnia magna TaxID=35525 RepID=A0ABQ9ZTT7_9CRUS|nr:hypothetical protein OUZ56_031291 [Daphnia magna]